MTPGSCPSDTSAHPRSHGENHSKGGKARTVPGSSPLTRGKRVFGGERQGCVRFIPAHAGKTGSCCRPRPACRAHPRSRGENGQESSDEGAPSGSSPITRGKRGLSVSFGLLWRLIPAHAGKTLFNRGNHSRSPAHPRSRGENSIAVQNAVRQLGSSPLTRGKPCQHRAPVPHAGLIPAHARKTYGRTASAPSSTAHPRSRGENSCESLIVSWVGGSSPLTRGKHSRPPRSQSTARLIPAHAGKTLRQTMEAQLNAAHPRSRGENVSVPRQSGKTAGSSPLTRGKRIESSRFDTSFGLIPAHAGKTVTRCMCDSMLAVHPRSRGENRQRPRQSRPRSGSSPLTRGKPDQSEVSLARLRLIPAHAGKTRARSPTWPATRAHPRSRGENMYRSSSSHPTAGSSPLTRGKREVAKVRGCDLGLIPAHAGKTVGEELPGQIMWAHPRSRGENPRSNGSPTSIGGSSPLTRGKPRYRAMRARRRWLIPAHAGKTAI